MSDNVRQTLTMRLLGAVLIFRSVGAQAVRFACLPIRRAINNAISKACS